MFNFQFRYLSESVLNVQMNQDSQLVEVNKAQVNKRMLTDMLLTLCM
jgi:hypothetical protein